MRCVLSASALRRRRNGNDDIILKIIGIRMWNFDSNSPESRMEWGWGNIFGLSEFKTYIEILKAAICFCTACLCEWNIVGGGFIGGNTLSPSSQASWTSADKKNERDYT